MFTKVPLLVPELAACPITRFGSSGQDCEGQTKHCVAIHASKELPRQPRRKMEILDDAEAVFVRRHR